MFERFILQRHDRPADREEGANFSDCLVNAFEESL
jgi:hypothetical protein